MVRLGRVLGVLCSLLTITSVDLALAQHSQELAISCYFPKEGDKYGFGTAVVYSLKGGELNAGDAARFEDLIVRSRNTSYKEEDNNCPKVARTLDVSNLLQIEVGTEPSFGTYSYGILELDFDGGNVIEAIKISQLVRDLPLATVIEENGRCVSACAIIFMHGRFPGEGVSSYYRLIRTSSFLGFHRPRIVLNSTVLPPPSSMTANVLKEWRQLVDEFVREAIVQAFQDANALLSEIISIDPNAWAPDLIAALARQAPLTVSGDPQYTSPDTVEKISDWGIYVNDVGPKIETTMGLWLGLSNACYNLTDQTYRQAYHWSFEDVARSIKEGTVDHHLQCEWKYEGKCTIVNRPRTLESEDRQAEAYERALERFLIQEEIGPELEGWVDIFVTMDDEVNYDGCHASLLFDDSTGVIEFQISPPTGGVRRLQVGDYATYPPNFLVSKMGEIRIDDLVSIAENLKDQFGD